ncbi:MAG: transglutaminase domain-containing protein [Calditrichaeota bacterium]|nr:transglutaminase domain-containing protein [Calditrichota bacterium]
MASLDSAARERFLDFVLPVRIDDEPASGRRERSQLASFLRKELPAMGPDSKGNRVRHWIARNITIERDPDRLGPPLLPSQVLALRRGTRRDIERLYIALCRQRGMPARRNPVSGEVEKWEVGSGWKSVPIARDERPGDSEMGKGKLQLEITSGDSLSGAALYLRDWALSRWKGDRGEPVDLGWHRPAREIITPVDLPVGWYLLTSGMRLKDGSVNATLRWFEVQTGRTTRQHLRLSPTGEANAGTTSGGAGE